MQIKTNTVLSSLSDELRQISNIPNDAGLINPLGTNTLTFDRLIMTNLASNTVDTITVTYSYDSANHCLVRTCKGVSTVICDNILNPEDINFKYDSKNIGLIINLTLTDTSISAIADLPTIFFSKAYADGKSNAFSSTTNFNIVRLINFHVQEINDKSYPEKRFPVSNAL